MRKEKLYAKESIFTFHLGGHAVNAEVLALLDYAVATKRPNAIVLEREQNFPPMRDLVDELRDLRRRWQRHADCAVDILSAVV